VKLALLDRNAVIATVRISLPTLTWPIVRQSGVASRVGSIRRANGSMPRSVRSKINPIRKWIRVGLSGDISELMETDAWKMLDEWAPNHAIVGRTSGVGR
jgi:hypothetical protein